LSAARRLRSRQRASAFLFLLAVLGSAAPAQVAEPPAVSKHIAKILARADGRSPETAYKVSSVRDEYQILQALGLAPGSQSLVFRKKPYDMLEATDPKTGAKREVWFDISAFFSTF
jgi:hypothetical protein